MSNTGDPKSGSAPRPASARDQRLAKALRDNLRRRKAPPAKPRTDDAGDKNAD